jgi:hypothetical protein
MRWTQAVELHTVAECEHRDLRELQLTTDKEASFMEGQRSAWTSVLRTVLRELGHHTPNVARMILEREELVAQLRRLCAEFGDNEWESTDYLPDVIEKHVYQK